MYMKTICGSCLPLHFLDY